MLITERRLRNLIKEALNEAATEAGADLDVDADDPVPTPTKANTPANQLQSTVKSFGFQPEIAESVITVKLLQEKIQSSLKIDSKTLCLLLKAALAISGRESSYGKGVRYTFTSWAETLMSQMHNSSMTPVSIIPKLIPAGDMSIGPTQIKYGMHFGPGAELAAYGSQVGITDAASLSGYPKAIMATIGVLSNLYQKAIKLGYTNEPGISSKAYKSTGNAALDLAIIGYNMGPTKMTNYCGKEDIKKPCAPGSPDIVKNYIPNFSSSPTVVMGNITSFGYIGEVSSELTKFSKVDTLF